MDTPRRKDEGVKQRQPPDLAQGLLSSPRRGKRGMARFPRLRAETVRELRNSVDPEETGNSRVLMIYFDKALKACSELMKLSDTPAHDPLTILRWMVREMGPIVPWRYRPYLWRCRVELWLMAIAADGNEENATARTKHFIRKHDCFDARDHMRVQTDDIIVSISLISIACKVILENGWEGVIKEKLGRVKYAECLAFWESNAMTLMQDNRGGEPLIQAMMMIHQLREELERAGTQT